MNKSNIRNIQYHPVEHENMWKVNVINECIDAKFGSLDIAGFTTEELDTITNYLCIS